MKTLMLIVVLLVPLSAFAISEEREAYILKRYDRCLYLQSVGRLPQGIHCECIGGDRRNFEQIKADYIRARARYIWCRAQKRLGKLPRGFDCIGF